MYFYDDRSHSVAAGSMHGRSQRSLFCFNMVIAVLIGGMDTTLVAQNAPSTSPYAELLAQSDYSLDSSRRKRSRKRKSKYKRHRKKRRKPYYAAVGEGRTLPKKVVRLRAPYKSAFASYGYDAQGQKQDLGLTLSAAGTALVLEYGATNKLSLQFLAPFVLESNLTLDADIFRESDVYMENYINFVGAVAQILIGQGVCASVSACMQLVENGYALPVDTEVTLPTGESLAVKAGVPIKTYADALVVGAARPLEGETGWGDVEVGFLYSIYRAYNFGISFGLGVRLPTGSFSDVPSAYLPTGRGTTDLGIRLNLDFSPLRGIWVSLQNQSEYMLQMGVKQKTSLLDNSMLNEADPTTAAAVAAGSDGFGNEQDFERKGLRNFGFLKLAWGLGNLDRSLEPIGVSAQYSYARQSEEYLNGISKGPPAKSASFVSGLTLDGLAHKFPAQLTYTHEVPISGENQTLAATIDIVTLKLYYKF